MSWSPKRESNWLNVSYDMNRLWWCVAGSDEQIDGCVYVYNIQYVVVRGWQRKRGGWVVKEWNDEGIPSLTSQPADAWYSQAGRAGPNPVSPSPVRAVSAPIVPSNK